MRRKILVCGAGGFIGTHLVSHLKQQGHYVVGADLKLPQWSTTDADEFHLIDLTDKSNVDTVVTPDVDEVYQLAADMGGAGYVFTGENDADIMQNSASINLNICRAMTEHSVNRVLFTSSACIYPFDQIDLAEHTAYPAQPDSDYGWEKLFAERLYAAYNKNYGIDVRIVRLHNVFGPLGSYNNGKEKAPAAICRKVAQAKDGIVEVWGNGEQTRSFLYIDECITGLQKIMASGYTQPINLGSEQMVTINELVDTIADIANKKITKNYASGPVGVAGRTSNNKIISNVCGWAPAENLVEGLEQTYKWIKQEIENAR